MRRNVDAMETVEHRVTYQRPPTTGTTTMSYKGHQGTLTQRITQTAYELEQQLVHFTLGWVGALEGILRGSYKGARSLQPHLTSTEGFKTLLYGERHKAEMQHMSITDLIKSWIPNFSSSKQQRSESPGPIALSSIIMCSYEVARPGSLPLSEPPYAAVLGFSLCRYSEEASSGDIV